ncbi:MAG: hypothetical protein COA70_10030 [Planctomycetota bacterium]|nr:MAG: hypothetical protein COA70_10030 [Planctomycetota bacterium]
MFAKRALFAIGQAICHPKLWVVAYVALAVAVLWRTPESAGDLGTSDSIEYATSAKHWVDGEGLTIITYGEVHPSRYPPGYAVLFLAPIYALGASSLGAGIYSVVATGIGLAILLWILCAQFLPSRQASCAAGITLGATLFIWQFDWVSRMIMSDIPGVFLFFVVWTAWLGRNKNPNLSYLIAGTATGIAVSLRLTHLAFCIPLLVGLFYVRPMSLFWRRASLLLVPILLCMAWQMFYYHQVFGSPLFTGYHYWLPPSAYSLSLESVGENLLGMLHIFSPEHKRTELWQWVIGPAMVACPLLAAWACRRWRPEHWVRTKEARVGLGLVALPIVLFYACYPFQPVRFMLFLYIAWFALGAVWTLSLCDRFPKWLLLAIFGTLVFQVQDFFCTKRAMESSYRHTLMVQSDAQLPEDALLIGQFSTISAQYFFVGDSARTFLPIYSKGSAHLVGAFGEERRPLASNDISRNPERIEEAFDAGRRVFLMTELTHWRTDDVILDQLLDKYHVQPSFAIIRKPSVVELTRK